MNQHQSVKDQFGKNASNYVTSPLHAKGKDLEWMKQWVTHQFPNKETLLDIATGGGHVANAFAPLFNKVTALDLTPEMLGQAENFIKGNGYKNVDFTIGDAQDLPFVDQSFDIVTCRVAPHHFPDVTKFVEEVYRVVKAGGVFILADNVVPEIDAYDTFFNELEKKRDYSHNRAFKKTEWLSIVELAGFRTDHLVTFEKNFSFETWCKNMSLSNEQIKEVNDWIMTASEDVRTYFSVQTFEDGTVKSFTGQSIVLIAWK